MTSHEPIDLSPDVEWWERQPGESAKMYDRFLRFLELPPEERSARKVAELLNASLPAITSTHARFRWRDRALAYEKFKSRKRVEKFENDYEELSRNSLNVARGAVALLGRSIGQLVKDPNYTIPESDLLAWARMADVMRKIAEGGADYTVEITGKDGGAIQVEHNIFEGLTEQQKRDRAREIVESSARLYGLKKVS